MIPKTSPDGFAERAFALHARCERQPELAHETTPQAFVLSTRVGG
jgi:hypothetical protein